MIFKTALMILTIQTALKNKADYTDINCVQLALRLPRFVNCPSFDIIYLYRFDGEISIFCRKYAAFFCFLKRNRFQNISRLWNEKMCTRGFVKIDTQKGIGRLILKSNKDLYDKICVKVLEHKSKGNFGSNFIVLHKRRF